MASACKKERMPWKASSVREEKLRFIYGRVEGESMTELCHRFGISRETGYVWLRRFHQTGLDGLTPLSRATHRHANQTPRDIEEMILELRQAHMRWGPRKLKWILERNEPWRTWPASSTIGSLLKREGLVVARKKRFRTAPYTEPLAHANAANRVWCADFKGWFRTSDGERIDPLTISDAYSRYLLRCQAVEKTDTARVQAIFEAAFREYGMPQAIRTDNGPPFASRAVAGLSRLAVWWIKLGITPERIEAGHPEQNGRHERMHRTMKQETADPPAANRRAQQRKMDQFREDYNQVRPHEALEMQTPAAIYQPSPRIFPARLPEPEYPATMIERGVRHHGNFRWKRHDVFLSEVFWGERIGLLPEDDRWFTIYFAEIPVARFDSHKLRVTPLQSNGGFCKVDAGEGVPSPAPHPTTPEDQKVSGMCPV
jgi:transposase InsO family protein